MGGACFHIAFHGLQAYLGGWVVTTTAKFSFLNDVEKLCIYL